MRKIGFGIVLVCLLVPPSVQRRASRALPGNSEQLRTKGTRHDSLRSFVDLILAANPAVAFNAVSPTVRSPHLFSHRLSMEAKLADKETAVADKVDKADETLATRVLEDADKKKTFKVGQIVNGTVVAVTPTTAHIDIGIPGAKPEGKKANSVLLNSGLGVADLTLKLNASTKLRARITSLKGLDGLIELSCRSGKKSPATSKTKKKKASAKKPPPKEKKVWPAKKRRFNGFKVGEMVEGTVAVIQKVGVFVDVGATRNAFLPAHDILPGTVPDPLAKLQSVYKIGDAVRCRVTEVDPSRMRFVVSIRDPNMDKFEPGQLVDAEIHKICSFGLLLEIGASVKALLPVQDLFPGELEDPIVALREIYKEGDQLQCKVVFMREDTGQGKKIRVTTRQEYEVGEIVEGDVRSIEKFGVFVDVGADNDALLPPINILGPSTGKTENLLEVLESIYQVGDRLRCRITGRERRKDQDKDRLIITVRASILDLEVGQEVEGTVTGINDFGVFVDIGAEKDVLLPVGVVLNKKEPGPDDREILEQMFSKGDMIIGNIANVDFERLVATITQNW